MSALGPTGTTINDALNAVNQAQSSLGSIQQSIDDATGIVNDTVGTVRCPSYVIHTLPRTFMGLTATNTMMLCVLMFMKVYACYFCGCRAFTT